MPYKDPELQRAYHAKWIKKRRDDYFAGKSCVRCGGRGSLQLDHLDPKTKGTHRIWSWRETRRLEELAKCQILCRPCHQAKTNEDFGWGEHLPHGTSGKYAKGCRCGDCREWNRQYRAAYRARKRQEGSVPSWRTPPAGEREPPAGLVQRRGEQ